MNILILIAVLFSGNPVRIPDLAALQTANVLGINTKVVLDNGAEYVIDNSGATINSPWIVQVGSSTKRAVLQYENREITLEQAGIVVGAGQSTAVQKSNWSYFKKLAARQSVINLPGDTLEIYPQDSLLIRDKALTIKGVSEKETYLSIFPKFKAQSRGNKYVFWVNRNAVFTLEDLTVSQYIDRYAFETYNVSANIGGNVNVVHLEETPRVGFWAALTVGDTINFQEDSITLGLRLIIASKDSVAATITFTTSTASTANYTTPTTLIGKAIPEGADYTDYSSYTAQWNSELYDATYFIHSNDTFDEFENKSVINLNRVTVTEVDRILSVVQTYLHVYITESRLSAASIAIAWTGTHVATTYDTDPLLRIDNSTIYECATRVAASVHSSTQDANEIYGSGIYNSVSCPALITNTKFLNNRSTAYRNLGGSISSVRGRRTDFENCIFLGTEEAASLILSNCFNSSVRNCQFYDQPVYVGYSADFQNCHFATNVGFNNNVTPDVADTVELHMSFDNCSFTNNAQISGDTWANGDLNDSRITVKNSTFFAGSSISSSAEYTTIDNCVLKAVAGFTPSAGGYFVKTGGSENSPLLLSINNFNIEPGVSLDAFASQYASYQTNLITIENSDLRGAKYLLAKPANCQVKNTLFQSVIVSNYRNGNVIELPKKQRYAEIATKTFNDWLNASSVAITFCMLADYNNDTYVVSDTVLKNIQFVPGRYYSTSTAGASSCNYLVNAEIKIRPINGLYIIPYAKDTTNSNFLGNDTVYIAPNETVRLMSNGSLTLSQTTQVDTLIDSTLVADIDSLVFQGNSPYRRTQPIKAGSIKVFVDGDLVAIDDGRGNLVSDFVTSGVTARGGIHYHQLSHGIYFSEPLTSGQEVLVTIEKHIAPRQVGAFSIIR